DRSYRTRRAVRAKVDTRLWPKRASSNVPVEQSGKCREAGSMMDGGAPFKRSRVGFLECLRAVTGRLAGVPELAHPQMAHAPAASAQLRGFSSFCLVAPRWSVAPTARCALQVDTTADRHGRDFCVQALEHGLHARELF